MDLLTIVDIVSLFHDSDRDAIKKFRARISHGKLIRDENPEDHFCVFIVPFDRKTGKVFLGHHKKANDWIPPGGHIEKNETPIESAIREAKEELGISVSERELKLFTLDYLDISAPDRACKLHWHIWYVFNTEETNYLFEGDEFHDAGWFSPENELRKIRMLSYRDVISRLMGTNI